jgi:hypothetical protein
VAAGGAYARRMKFVLWLCPLSVVGCSGKDGDPSPDDSDAPTIDDSGTDDTATDDSGTDDTGTAFDPCAGATVRPFQVASDDPTLYAMAGDFTVEVTDFEGKPLAWTLSEHWTGCDSVLVVGSETRQAYGYDTPLWARDYDDLIAKLPANVLVLFLATESDEKVRQASTDALREGLEAALLDLDPATAALWRARMWFGTEEASEIPGWLGSHFKFDDWGVGIDRFQHIRYIGSYADPDRFDSGIGWFEPNLSYAAEEAVYYNFESDRDDALASDGATVVPIWSGEVISDPHWAGQRGQVMIDLPALDAFDTMSFDLTLGCTGDDEYGDCPAWDYLVYLFQDSVPTETNPYTETPCKAGETRSGTCRYPDGAESVGTYTCDGGGPGYVDIACPSRELGRWITTYHRDGRWVHDASALLPLLGAGGSQSLSFYTQQDYEVSLALRLSSSGDGSRASATTHLFSGGTFNASYNEREPVVVDIPAGATKVELATVISGHGAASPGNCAEFCVTTHHFLVNGATDNVVTLSDAGSEDGCETKVGQGVVPNQYGTWWYGRSGWCPGWQVPVETIDITAQVVPGKANTFEYEGLRNDADYTSEGAWIDLESWLVVTEG